MEARSTLRPAAQPHGVGPPVLELLVVEKGVGAGGDDLVGQDRRLGRLAAVDPDLARLDPLQKAAQPVDVEGLVQGVVDRLADEQVVGDLDGADGVVLAGGGLRKHRRQQVVGLHALDRRGVALAAAEAQHQQRSIEVPAPSGLEHRRVEDGVLEGVAQRSGSDT